MVEFWEKVFEELFTSKKKKKMKGSLALEGISCPKS